MCEQTMYEAPDEIPNEVTGTEAGPAVKKVRAAREEKVCPQCGISLPGDSVFCEKYGTTLEI